MPLAGDPFGESAYGLRRRGAARAGCTRCKLTRGRNTIVFGAGDPRRGSCSSARDPALTRTARAKPFVGRAGQLLTE